MLLMLVDFWDILIICQMSIVGADWLLNRLEFAMTIPDICTYPEKILRKPAKPITAIDDKIVRLAD